MKLKHLVLLLTAVVLLGACAPMPDIPKTPTLGNLTLPVSGTQEIWSSADYQGRPVLIAVMATWCPWCKRSLVALDQTSAAYDGKVEVVGVFIDDDPALVEQVKKDHQMKTKALYQGNEAAHELGVQGFPHIMLFDKKHKLVKVWSGYSDTLADQYKQEIDKLLK